MGPTRITLTDSGEVINQNYLLHLLADIAVAAQSTAPLRPAMPVQQASGPDQTNPSHPSA